MWSVFTVPTGPRSTPTGRRRRRSTELFDQADGKDIVTRGTYDVRAMRADADLMIWWQAPTADDAAGDVRRLPAHPARPAPASRSGRHGAAPPGRVQQEPHPGLPGRRGRRETMSASTPSSGPTSGTCCPTRSAARCWPSTARWPASTRTCAPTRSPRFALGDYEWMLAFEADELHRIVDLMRHLRGAERGGTCGRRSRSTPAAASRRRARRRPRLARRSCRSAGAPDGAGRAPLLRRATRRRTHHAPPRSRRPWRTARPRRQPQQPVDRQPELPASPRQPPRARGGSAWACLGLASTTAFGPTRVGVTVP